MKVLFAVNNDNISNAIVKKYQQEYKEIISYKNVYYFNAILKELQNNRTYDRIVISEDLEPFANNNYDTIDKFLFEKLDRISDEATKANGEDIEVILICADRRSKSDEMLTRIFGIGIYNALIGDERSIENLCKLMNQPRNKKEAKLAYKIEGNSVGYQAEDENNVSEAEVQNILAHYKRLGKDEDRYVDSFNNIVSQYTDAQLKIIIRYLPMNVKAVLEERSPKYQELSTFSKPMTTSKNERYIPKTAKSIKKEEKIKVKMLKDEKDKINKPIVIPSALNNKKTTKIQEEKPKVHIPNVEAQYIEPQYEDVNNENDLLEQLDSEIQEMTKRGRGRPRKNPIEDVDENKPKRGRGRPKKNIEPEEDLKDKNELESTENFTEDEFDLFSMENENDNSENSNTQGIEENNNLDLFSLEDEKQEDDNDLDLFSLEPEENTLPSTQETEETDEGFDLFEPIEEPVITPSTNNIEETKQDTTSMEPTYKPQTNLNTVLTSKKKLVAFIGTTKNGTSFVVNNLALILASMNISTAILDMTKSKNSYYIYTNDDNKLRTIAEQCIFNLEKGVAKGIDINRNLTVYTEVPGEGQEHKNIETILATLMEQHDVVLIDADFNTEPEYFENSQEIYLVQSMDVLTIQPLTAFMRNLKSKGILKQEKLKVVINKWQRVSGLTEKVLIGGMSSYNDPSMSFMTELFNKENIQYCKIPFEIQNNVKYLEALVNCQMSLRGYTKQLMESLNELASMVYPLYNQRGYSPLNGNKKNRMQFSEATRNTLNRMKNNY